MTQSLFILFITYCIHYSLLPQLPEIRPMHCQASPVADLIQARTTRHHTHTHTHANQCIDWYHFHMPVCGCSGVVAEYWTRNKRLPVRLTPDPLQATLSKLLSYCVLRPTQPPTISGTGKSSSYGYEVKA